MKELSESEVEAQDGDSAMGILDQRRRAQQRHGAHLPVVAEPQREQEQVEAVRGKVQKSHRPEFYKDENKKAPFITGTAAYLQ